MNINNPLGLGTASIGRPLYINIKENNSQPESLNDFKNNSKKVLEEAYSKGIRYFDTAPGYGLAEELLVEWVSEKKDKTIELATKWGYTYVANFDLNATKHEEKEHSLEKLNEQWSFSKKLLPYLSTYQIHSATSETGVLKNIPILERLAELKLENNLLIGITSTGVNQVEIIKEALNIKVQDNYLFDTFQVTYNILDQSLLSIIEELKSKNKRVIVKEALANGRLFPNSKFPHYKDLYENLQTLAQKYKVGTDAIALRFCIDTIEPYSVLSGASNSNQLNQNLKTMNFKLTDSECNSLKKLAIKPSEYWEERAMLNWN